MCNITMAVQSVYGWVAKAMKAKVVMNVNNTKQKLNTTGDS